MLSIRFNQGLVGLLSIAIACLPFHGIADVQREAGLDGQQEGKALLQSWIMPTLKDDTILIPTGNGSEALLLPSLFPGMENGALDDITDAYGSELRMEQLGQEQQNIMTSDSSVTGEAFRSLQQIKDRSRPDMVNDPIWSVSDAVQADPNLLSHSFSDCATNEPNRPQYLQCDRRNTAVNNCTIKHDYTAGIIEHVSGPMNLRTCGEGCLDVWIGRIGDNYWGGYCQVFEQSITLKVVNPDAITSAVLEYAKWDDYMQVWLGDQKVWSGPNSNFPPETTGACELSTSWERNPNTDLSAQLKAVTPGLEVPLKIRVSVTGNGEGFARIKIRFDPKKVVMEDKWIPQTCVDQANDITQEFSDYRIECTDQPSSSNGCAVINGVTVCESYFTQRPISSISPLCRRVQVSVDESSYQGRDHASCDVFEQDPKCGFISSTCAKTNTKGECIRFTDTYDCDVQETDPTCVVSDLMPTGFNGCQPIKTITPFTETKYVPDYQVCEKIHTLTQCQLERRLFTTERQQTWSIEPDCVEAQTLTFTPSQIMRLQKAAVSLSVSENDYAHAVITQHPTKENGWQTLVALSTVTQTQNEATEHLQLGKSTCSVPATLKASLTFKGQYLDQDIIHLPNDPNVRACLMQSDQFTAVQWQCADSKARTIDGLSIGANELTQFDSLYPTNVSSPSHLTSRGSSDGLGASCWIANATYNASTAHPEFSIGSSAPWLDNQGNTQIITNTLENTTTNTCKALEQDPSCRYIKSECTEGGAGHDGFCYVENQVFDCGQSVDIQNALIKTEYQCEGAIRCMGTDCLAPESIKQADFAQAATMLNLAQSMTNDMICTGTDGKDNVECTLFNGTKGECKKAVGGIVDCCEKPAGVSLSDYIGMLLAVNKLDTAVMAMDPSSAIYGTWNTLRAPMTNSWSAVKEPFVTAWDSLMGSGPSTAASASAEQAATGFMQVLTNKTAEWVGTTFGSGAQSALFTNVGGALGTDGVVSGGNFTLGGAAGTVVSTVMTAYMIYAVTMILIQIIWKCEQKEFEMNAKRALKSCQYVGSYCVSSFLGRCVEKRQSYCCFSSPLSRIIQAQIRPQLGLNWGSATAPNCAGVTASELNKVNWSQVNLDEWIGILSLTGNLPDASSLDMDRLTGQGSTLNVDSNRQHAADRAIERVNGVDVQKRRQEATESLSENSSP